MGFKLAAVLGTLLIAVCSFSVEKSGSNTGCIELQCPETAPSFGLQNLVNEETLKTDVCTACSQCADNGYSVCLRAHPSRALRATAGACSCAHQLAANCHTDLTATRHPSNLTMRRFTACYTDSVQRPPQPLAVNENSSIVVTIEPFWLEPYWRHLKVENVTLHYKFAVKAPEHCEGVVESTDSGEHTCVASVVVDLSDDQPQIKDDQEYDHSDNYDQYDDDLPPEVQFDRDVFSGAKQLEAYYTATVRRARQINPNAVKSLQIFDSESVIESDHLKFDLKPEVYGEGETEIVSGPPTDDPFPVETEKEDDDEEDVSEEKGGTNFFEEEDDKKTTVESKEDEEDDGVVQVNLEDIEPTKLKSQEEAKMDSEEDTTTTTTEAVSTTTIDTTTDTIETETSTISEIVDEVEEKNSSEDSSSSEETTVETVDAEESPDNFWSRFVNSSDFDRIKIVFLVTLALFVLFLLCVICIFYRNKYCCCSKSQDSKTANGYRYTSANNQTELVSREKEHLRQ